MVLPAHLLGENLMPWSSDGQKERREQAIVDHPGRQHVRTCCLFCPTRGRTAFVFTGTLWEGRAALAKHRAEKHPELQPLEQAMQRTRRRLRSDYTGERSYSVDSAPRHLSSPEELAEREILRRMTRSDLPALKGQ
jgi:hypothetical protein